MEAMPFPGADQFRLQAVAAQKHILHIPEVSIDANSLMREVRDCCGRFVMKYGLLRLYLGKITK